MKSKNWVDAVNKEDALRLAWFLKNEAKLRAATEKQVTHRVTDEMLDEITEDRKKLYSERKQYPRIATEDVPNEPVEAPGGFMKPVAPEVTNIIYNSSNRGRINYLHERNRVLPENRYYFPETTSYRYGWKMWDCAKTMGGSKFGKSAIVRNTFYRRRAGVERDPDWYTYPAKLSPTVCN